MLIGRYFKISTRERRRNARAAAAQIEAQAAPAEPADTPSQNRDGVTLLGRSLAYNREIELIAKHFDGREDLKNVIDVMDHSYLEAFTRVSILQSELKDAKLIASSEHLPLTLTWVDGILKKGRKRVAVVSRSIYYHHSANVQSQIDEGIRRIGGELEAIVEQFRPGGIAERQEIVGNLSEVVLGFDTRGHGEIKTFLQEQELALRQRFGDRFRFKFLDDVVGEVPRLGKPIRHALNMMINAYKNNDRMLAIIEGVVYSRYVGMLHELKTAQTLQFLGHKILSLGRELLHNGAYYTELDAVTQSPSGLKYLIEAKSARVPLTPTYLLSSKFLYKLNRYKERRGFLEKKALGGQPLRVIFSVDVGASQPEVKKLLIDREKELSAEYGFEVHFLFIKSFPGSQVRPTATVTFDWEKIK